MEISIFPIGPSDLAPRACSQCRESKKKCDKKLPKCTRCDRLALDCLYGEPGNDDNQLNAPVETRWNNDIESKLDEILRRLDRLEARDKAPPITTPTPTGTLSPQGSASSSRRSAEFNKPNTDRGSVSASRGPNSNPQGPSPVLLNCQINPSLLRPSYWSLITVMNIGQTLHKEGTSASQIAQKYMSTVHTWMPIVSSDSFARKVTAAENLDCSPEFAILLLSMYVFARKKTTVTEIEAELPVYLLCKHLFAGTQALAGVSWDLVHAGILLGLYENMHGILEKAKMTIRTCMAMVSLLVENENRRDSNMQVPMEEVRSTWWVVAIVDRYINPLSSDPSGIFLIMYGDITGSPAANESNSIYSHTIAPWKSLPTDPTLSGEAKAAQLLGEVQQFIHTPQLVLSKDCHKFAGFHEKILRVLGGLVVFEYCPCHNDSHAGHWTSLSAVLLFHCFCYQKAVHGGIEEILSLISVGFKEAIQVANDRARLFTEAPQNINLDCHEVSPSMITSLFLGRLGEYLLEQWGDLSSGARYYCKDLLIRLGVDWGLAGNYLACLDIPSLSIEELLQRG